MFSGMSGQQARRSRMFPPMMIALRRAGAGLVTALVLVPVALAPAWSDTYNHRDARHDVAGTPKGGGDYHRVRANRVFDVTHLRVVHGLARIRFNVELRSASMNGLKWRTLSFKLKTDGDTYSGDWQQYHSGFQYDFWDDTAGKQVHCGSAQNGRERRTIWLSLARSCFDDPRWIRAAVGVGGDIRKRALQDNAQSDSWRRLRNNRFSPRLHSS